MTLNDWSKENNIKTLHNLAVKLGVDDTTNPARLVHTWLKGISIPSKNNMKKIMDATNGQVTPNDFYSN
tara:strand:+ start:961 stop:1167 length:207 start_codon:yes stop_codon:yes gene_type:complete